MKKGILSILFAAASALMALVPLILSFTSRDGNIPGLGPGGAIFSAFWGLVAFLIVRRIWPLMAPYPSMLIGALLIAKVKFAPVTSLWQGKREPFPLFSETHLYFIIPGAILVAGSFLVLLRSGDSE